MKLTNACLLTEHCSAYKNASIIRTSDILTHYFIFIMSEGGTNLHAYWLRALSRDLAQPIKMQVSFVLRTFLHINSFL